MYQGSEEAITVTFPSIFQSGTNSSIACLVKIDLDIETSKTMMTIRTPNPLASRFLLQILASYLLVPPQLTGSSIQSQGPSTPIANSSVSLSTVPGYPTLASLHD